MSRGVEFQGAYRYTLDRVWGTGDRVLFVMLNPSTADALQDDPTIRRCIRFAQKWGYAGLEVVNLFAYRATDPKELWQAAEQEDIVGPRNDSYIQLATLRSDIVVVAWGTGGSFQQRGEKVLQLLKTLKKPICCLGLTQQGHPRHPLYLAGDSPLQYFEV